MESRIKLLSLEALRNLAGTHAVPLIDGFMDCGSLCVLAGSSKAGKTALATYLAFSVAKGESVLGMPSTKGPVLWVTYEESPGERWHLCKEYDGESPVFHLHEPLPFDTDQGIAQIRAAIEESKAILVVIDALVAGVSCVSLSESVKTRQTLKPLNDLRIETGVSVLLLHHQNKGQHANASPDKMSDSHQIASVCTQFWNYSYRKAKEGRLITLEGRGRHRNGDKAWKIRSHAVNHYELADESVMKVENAKKPSVASLLLNAMLPDTLYTAEGLSSTEGIVAGSVRNALKSMSDDRQVIRIKVPGKRGVSYKLADPVRMCSSETGESL